MHEFTHHENWFDKKYYAPMAMRFATFKTAMNLFTARKGTTVVETGCMRGVGDFGAGCSSMLFCEYLSRYGGHLYTVDINPKNIATCNAATEQWAPYRTCTVDDSVHYLENLSPDIVVDFLYLDSFDYPYGDLLNIYGGRTDITAAAKALQDLGDAEIVRRHGELIDPCQQHCLRELEAAWPHLHASTIILIDDASLPGGGKPRLALDYLAKEGWICLLDLQQTLWISG